MDWKPYAPHSTRPIVDEAADVARSLGFRVDAGDVHQHETGLLAGDPQFGPHILIVDPWALLVPYTRQLLERLNDRRRPWVQVVIPWRADDEASRQEEGKLRAALDAAFQNKLSETASISEMAALGVPSQSEFDTVLGRIIGAAAKHYLRSAPAFPSFGEIVARPRIS